MLPPLCCVASGRRAVTESGAGAGCTLGGLRAQGLVDVDEEVKKLDKNLDKLRKSREGLQAQMALPGYETKIPEAVRQQNDQKVRGRGPSRARVPGLTPGVLVARLGGPLRSRP